MMTPPSFRLVWPRIARRPRAARAAGGLALLGALVLAVAVSGQTAASQPPAAPAQGGPPPAPAPGATATAPAAQSTARIGDANGIVRLTGATTQVVLTMSALGAAVDKLTATELAAFAATLKIAPTVRLGPPASHTATIADPRFYGRAGAGTLSWLVTVTSTDLPANSSERRATRLSIGPGESPDVFPLEFTLTNQPAAAAQYDVTAPTHDWMVSRSDADPDRTYPLLVVNRSEPITGLRLAQVSLKRADDGGSVPFDEVQLVESASAKPTAKSASIDLGPNESRTVFLRLGQSERLLPYGSFAGQVQLVSNGTSPKPVALTARITSSGVRRLGSLLVLLGLLTSLFITARLQPRLARLQALRPATLVRDAVVKFALETAKLVPGEVDGIVTEAEKQAARLETRALDEAGLLPLAISVAGGVTGETATGLKARLDDVSGRLAGLMVLRDTIAKLVAAHPKSNRPAPVQDAIGSLNDAAGAATSASVADAAAKAILDAMNTALAAVPGPERFFDPVPARVTTEQLDFLLHQTASVAAFIWAAVSLAIGVTYVYSDVDFGTPVDLLGMFLWGLGLTAFGAGIQQLTPQQVATRVGVAMPKSGTAGG
jgi:hypothetical protein